MVRSSEFGNLRILELLSERTLELENISRQKSEISGQMSEYTADSGRQTAS